MRLWTLWTKLGTPVFSEVRAATAGPHNLIQGLLVRKMRTAELWFDYWELRVIERISYDSGNEDPDYILFPAFSLFPKGEVGIKIELRIRFCFERCVNFRMWSDSWISVDIMHFFWCLFCKVQWFFFVCLCAIAYVFNVLYLAIHYHTIEWNIPIYNWTVGLPNIPKTRY